MLESKLYWTWLASTLCLASGKTVETVLIDGDGDNDDTDEFMVSTATIRALYTMASFIITLLLSPTSLLVAPPRLQLA